MDKKRRIAENSRRTYLKRRDDLWSVYYLPEEHYIGVSCHVVNRMSQHRNRDKRITEGYEILAKFERQVDAHWFEILFHIRGYNGFRTGNKQIK